MARLNAASRVPLTEGWELAEHPAASPAELATARWLKAIVPGTVASALRAEKQWSQSDARDFDASDWWFRCRFSAEPGAARLGFDGLATLAEVWLNGERILESRSMFVAHRVDVHVEAENELLVRFASLGRALAERRPRPRWKTRLVAQQQLRWFRTTLLGRMPGWSSRPAPVGPFRPVWLERGANVEADVRVSMEGDVGVVSVVRSSASRLMVGEHELTLDGGAGTLRIPAVRRWWPHTHGAPALYPARLLVDGVEHELEPIGFRTVSFADSCLKVNGERVFCRGVCWTPLDAVSFTSSREAYRTALERLRDAGMNMIRVGGTMTYESPDFHALCDELGILVFQDLMFANMDYPASDAAFVELARREVHELADRLQTSPSLAVLCGSSEVEQQIAMLGMPRESWTSPLFSDVLPASFAERRGDVAYVTSSPTGGTLPFRPGAGLAHYYGVGAYLRPLEDARRAAVRFATESLAFANVPERATIDRLLAGGESPAHHPRWKDGVPRDHGVGWDFEDVRDHYVRELYGVDPMRLRYADPERWLALGRVVPGELMEGVFSEWRRVGSSCNGGLVWFHQDLAPGAGFGVVDSEGLPKAPYWYLRRVLQPVALLVTDEGTNGLCLHVVNERATALEGELAVQLYRHGEVLVREAKRAVSVEARGASAFDAEEILGGFVDATYAFRFGPPAHDLVVATLTTAEGVVRAFHYPLGLPREVSSDLGLEALATPVGEGAYSLRVSARRFAHAVSIDAPGYTPDDDYFHLPPGASLTVRLRPLPGARALSGDVAATNGLAHARIVLGAAR